MQIFSLQKIFFCIFVSYITKTNGKSGKEDLGSKNNESKRPSPILNLCFESNGDDDHKATILLSRKIYPENIYLMRNEDPENVNGYVVDKVIEKEDYKFKSKNIEVNLSELDLSKDNKLVYSFKIEESGNTYQSEAFKYDKRDKKFKLVREIKGSFLGLSWATILYVGLVVIGVLICLFILMKIMNR